MKPKEVIGNIQAEVSNLSIHPQAYTGAPPTDEKEKIIWVRFERADINGEFAFADHHGGLLLSSCCP